MMPLIPCRACGRQISITASACPNCGDNVQNYIREEFPTRAVGFPLGPMKSWEPHFWYYGGCKGTTVVKVQVGWVRCSDTLFTLNYHDGDEPATVTVKSPFDAIVVREEIKIHNRVDFNYPSFGGMDDRQFMVLRPKGFAGKEGAPFEKLHTSDAYRQLRDRIFQIVDRQGLFGPSDKAYRKFDPKNIFDSREALLKKASHLLDVTAVWLPDWEYRDQYTF